MPGPVAFSINVEQDEFEAKMAELANQGIVPTEPGQIYHSGCLLHYSYTAPLLRIQISSKPFFLSYQDVENKIREWFGK